jgi:hypothetical protein
MEKKTWRWPPILIGGVLLVAYFSSRLFNLTILPLFLDEGMHIGWSLQIAEEGRLFGITDVGKNFPIWVMSLIVPRRDSNLLETARFLSVLYGMFGLLGCYWLGQQLFDRRVGSMAALLYLVVPFTFFYDRMALVDGLLATLAIYVVLLSIGLGRKADWKYSIGLGTVLALAYMTKFNGFVLGVLPVLLFVTYLDRPIRARLWKWLLLSYGISAIGLLPLFVNFSTHWHSIGRKLWLGSEGTVLWSTWLLNGRDTLLFLAHYLTWPIFLVVSLGVGLAAIRCEREKLMLLVIAGVTMATFVFFPEAGRLYPRYLLPAAPFLLMIAAHTMLVMADKLTGYMPERAGSSWTLPVASGLILVISLPALWFDYQLAVDPVQAPFVKIDQYQYISGSPAGYGLREAADYLKGQLQGSEQIIVVYDEHPSHIPRGVQIYLHNQPDIKHRTLAFWREEPEYLAQHLLMQSNPVYIVVSNVPEPGSEFDFEAWSYVQRLAQFNKPGGLNSILIYGKVKWGGISQESCNNYVKIDMEFR